MNNTKFWGEAIVKDSEKVRLIESKKYTSLFDKKKCKYVRWGALREDKPDFSPFGVENLYIQLQEKENDKVRTMTLSDYIQILKLIPRSLNQIIIDVIDLRYFDKIKEILKYNKKKNIITNINLYDQNLNNNIIKDIYLYCNQVTLNFIDKDITYNAIFLLTAMKYDSVNMSCILNNSKYKEILSIIKDLNTNQKIFDLNSLIFIPSYKNPITIKNFKKICLSLPSIEKNVIFGKGLIPYLLKFIDKYMYEKKDILIKYIFPCEAGLFSLYLDINGKYFPCKRAKGIKVWKEGLILKSSFMEDIWFHKKMIQWRKEVLSLKRCRKKCIMRYLCRKCIIYNLNKGCYIKNGI